MGEDIFTQLEELVNAGEYNLDVAIKVYGYLKENGFEKLAEKVNELLTDYANDDLCASEVKENPLYGAVRQILHSTYNKEIIICSAVMAEDGTIYRGHRHGDAMRACDQAGRKLFNGHEQQGFITSRNRYVLRSEARRIQDEAGIKSADPDGYRKDTLFSEDLY